MSARSRSRQSGLFRLCGRLSLRRDYERKVKEQAERSLPLMRKTFIEATTSALMLSDHSSSLPLMRKTFIEATVASGKPGIRWPSLFRLCGRLSLRLPVAAHEVDGFPGLFRLCGRLSLRPMNPSDTSLLSGVSSAYAEDFH